MVLVPVTGLGEAAAGVAMAGTVDATLANVAVERVDALRDDTTRPPRIVLGSA